MRILEIKKNDAGQRLDKFLAKAVKGLPTSMMYKLVRTKKIVVGFILIMRLNIKQLF